MKRVFYVAFGAAVGVLVVRRITRAAAALSPQGVAGSFVQSVQEFAADVREAMAEREEEIREALGLDDDDDDDDDDGADGEPVDALAAPAAGSPLPRRRRG